MSISQVEMPNMTMPFDVSRERFPEIGLLIKMFHCGRSGVGLQSQPQKNHWA